jgi:hypothetical protein
MKTIWLLTVIGMISAQRQFGRRAIGTRWSWAGWCDQASNLPESQFGAEARFTDPAVVHLRRFRLDAL